MISASSLRSASATSTRCLQRVRELRQFPIQSRRFIKRALQLCRLFRKAPAGFVQPGGKRAGLLCAK